MNTTQRSSSKSGSVRGNTGSGSFGPQAAGAASMLSSPNKALRFFPGLLALGLIMSLTALILPALTQELILTTKRIDTTRVFVLKPMMMNAYVDVEGGRRPAPTIKRVGFVSFVELFRVDTVVTITYPFAFNADTVYGENTRGKPDSLVLRDRASSRSYVVINSRYFDLVWRPVATPRRFLPDALAMPVETLR